MQCGSFRGATQKGLKIGTIRDVLPHVSIKFENKLLFPIHFFENKINFFFVH